MKNIDRYILSLILIEMSSKRSFWVSYLAGTVIFIIWAVLAEMWRIIGAKRDYEKSD